MACSKILLLLLPLLLSAPVVPAEDDADAVNERIPVTTAEMEEHWQLDCSASWATLLDAVSSTDTGFGCTTTIALQRQLQLCAFVYQPPGRPITDTCPDYRSAYLAATKSDCGAIIELSRQAAQCGK